MKCKRCGDCCYFNREIINGKIINSNPCHFLAFENNLAYCKIYDNRPFTCRNYFCDKDPLIKGKKWGAKGVKIELDLLNL